MTSPALVVLTLALVCSINGVAPEQTADRASEHATNIEPEASDPNTAAKMGPWTNLNYIVNRYVDVNNHINTEISRNENNIRSKEEDFKEFKSIAISNPDGSNEFSEIIKSNNIFNKSPDFFKEGKLNSQINKNLVRKRKKPEFDDIYTDKLDKESTESLKFVKRDIELSELSNDVYKEFINHEELGSTIVANTKYLDLGKKGLRVFNDTPIERRWNKRRVKRQDGDKIKNCDKFQLNSENKIFHPHNSSRTGEKLYFSEIECVLTLTAGDKEAIKLTFVDQFHIEEHPNCAYDYLEIRDGQYGYAKPLGRFCGQAFPPPLVSSGPFMWLRFKSDDTIEYEGFTIKVENVTSPTSHRIPSACEIQPLNKTSGVIDTENIKECKDQSANHELDVLWTIETEKGTDIYLNFTTFELAKPNECEKNVVQVFGEDLIMDSELAHYCGSAANSVSTRVENPKTPPKAERKGNIMHVHLFLDQQAKGTKISAVYTAYRTLGNNEKCNEDTEFSCEDNTCIDKALRCDSYAHCRLKTDEDPETCKNVKESLIADDHILAILIIFSLILSGMSFVFIFKCIKKLYQDHKAIKEHIRQSTEDRLDTMITGSRLILDPKSLREPRASLERENHTNELFKQQRSISQSKGLPQQTSIESDFQETHLYTEDEPGYGWHRDVERIPEPIDVKVERNGRSRRSDTSKKEESLKSRKESLEEKREIRDAAVGAPDTKESGCQTRESLFQADPTQSSDGSNSASNSRGFSTFGYSGATLVRPSPPPPAPAPMISSTQIELLRQLPSLDTGHKSQKKIPDRRPMSAETTRSAPDVIIVSKPIR